MKNNKTEDIYNELFNEFREKAEKLEIELLDRIIQKNSSADGSLNKFHEDAEGYMQITLECPHPNGGYYSPDPCCAFVALSLAQAITDNKYLSKQECNKQTVQNNSHDLVVDDIPF